MPSHYNTTLDPVNPGTYDGSGRPDSGLIGGNNSDYAHRADSRFGAWWDRHASEYTAWDRTTGAELNSAWSDWVALQQTYGHYMGQVQGQMDKLDPLTNTGYYAPQQEFQIELGRSSAQNRMNKDRRGLQYTRGAKSLEGSGLMESLDASLMKGYEDVMAAEIFDSMEWARGQAGAAEEIMGRLQEQFNNYQTYLI